MGSPPASHGRSRGEAPWTTPANLGDSGDSDAAGPDGVRDALQGDALLAMLARAVRVDRLGES